jgi:hypothetical protein
MKLKRSRRCDQTRHSQKQVGLGALSLLTMVGKWEAGQFSLDSLIGILSRKGLVVIFWA